MAIAHLIHVMQQYNDLYCLFLIEEKTLGIVWIICIHCNLSSEVWWKRKATHSASQKKLHSHKWQGFLPTAENVANDQFACARMRVCHSKKTSIPSQKICKFFSHVLCRWHILSHFTEFNFPIIRCCKKERCSG